VTFAPHDDVDEGRRQARDVDTDRRWPATLVLSPSGLSIGEPNLVQFLVRFVLGPIARTLYRPRVQGIENMPRQGAVILAMNHRAALDTAVIALITPRAVRFLGKAEYFTGRGLKGWLMAHILSGLGYVPVERGNARAGLAALE
jgi:1-acyl-sn-glycerol-3-phosphate acyltransferase